jgi:hypothetical protein
MVRAVYGEPRIETAANAVIVYHTLGGRHE